MMHFRTLIGWLAILCFLCSITLSSNLFASFEEPIPTEREAFLDEIQKRALHYFMKQTNPTNGLVRDWAFNSLDRSEPFMPVNRIETSQAPATIAGTGFALSAYGVGVSRGWLDRGAAIRMVRKALLFLRDTVPQEHGFFYHFLNFEDGKRADVSSEVSVIDTGLAVVGALFAAEYLKDPEITGLAREIYERIDWPWMLNGGLTFAHGWSPERKFFPKRWSTYDESILIYLLALGSPTHPIPAESWKKIVRKVGSYQSYHLIQSPPLFTHQYPHIWFDLRNKNDGFADYFENSRRATLAQRQFAIDQSTEYSTYGPNSWGLTASDSFWGYGVFGAPPGITHHDGTVAPTGCGASIVFAPEESLACLEHFRDAYGSRLWGPYGFSDAFDTSIEWFSAKVYAINQGPILLMIENHRSGLIWNVMNQLPWVQRAFEKAGFRRGTIEPSWPNPPEAEAPSLQRPIQVDGHSNDWPSASEKIVLDESTLEYGYVAGDQNLRAEVQFAWDQEFFYFYADIKDDFLVLRNLRSQIYRDDLIELYIDPQANGLYWNQPEDFQIGFRANPNGTGVAAWSWFQGGEDLLKAGQAQAQGGITEKGYQIEGAIRWSYLGLHPESLKKLKLSVAIHNKSRDGSEAKYNWFFRSEGGLNRFELGNVNLVQDRNS